MEAFLFGDDSKAFNKGLEGSESPEERNEVWRKRGPVGKLHNIVYYITRTSKRIQKFSALQIAENDRLSTLDDSDRVYALVRNGGVRWNSTYLMIERAIKLRHAINSFCYETEEMATDQLSLDDWADLAKVMEILEPFWELTVQLQGCVSKYGHEGLLHDVVTAIEDLLAGLREHNIHYEHASDDHYLSKGVKAAIRLMERYVKLTRESSAWAAAVVLHPASKWKDFENSSNWKNMGELAGVKRAVKKLWEDHYRKNEAGTLDVPSGPALKKRRFDIGHRYALSSHRINEDGRLDDPAKPPDDYMRYCRDPLDDIEDAIQWWRTHEHIYPQLARLAWDMLPIPAMSTECERTFSKAGYQLTPQRSQLGDDILEASECLKQWLTMGVVEL